VHIVLDTNVIVSGILSATGASRAILDLARRGQVNIMTSEVLLEELEDVLGRFMPRAAAAEIRVAIEELAIIVEPEHVPEVARDRDDDHVLAAAVAAGANSIVTRDRDLLILDSYDGIEILEPAPALEMIRATMTEDD
jgi:uncharacterized protein